MAKNTNPFTKNLLIKQSWNTISLPITDRVKHGSNEFIKDKFIKDLINGSFLNLGLLTSGVCISKNCLGQYTIQFLYFPLNHVQTKLNHSSLVLNLLKVLNLIFSVAFYKQCSPRSDSTPLSLPNSLTAPGSRSPASGSPVARAPLFKFICVRAANKFVDGKILNDFVHYSVLSDPSRLKYVVSTLIREYKQLNIKKYDTVINKSKHYW
jgi:hypothetical protein